MATNFLYRNIRWNLKRDAYDCLLGLPSTKEQFYDQLEKLSRKYFPERKRIETLETEFCLNKIALKSAKTDAQKTAKEYFNEYWSKYTRVKKVFEKNYLIFPASGKTRLETAAELIAKCTQFAYDDKTAAEMCHAACDILQLTDRERDYLEYAVELYEIRYYCAATLGIFAGKRFAESCFARAFAPTLLKESFCDNTRYRQSGYGQSRLITVVDCMGNSAAQFDDVKTAVSTKLFIYANGRNVFDTFVKSKFGKNTAEFRSDDKTVKVSMQYFLQGTSEVRKITVKNCGKKSRRFTVEIPVAYGGSQDKNAYFTLDDALCVADGDKLYVAVAVTQNNRIIPCCRDKSLEYDFAVKSGEQVCFDVVTVYSPSAPELSEELRNLRYFGATVCPYLYDKPSNDVRTTNVTLNLTAHGYAKPKRYAERSDTLNYSYQLGDNCEATFVDNAGNSATLINGFVFGVAGESVYSVAGGFIKKINEKNFHLDVDRLIYDNGSRCEIHHDDGKNYAVTHAKPCKTLFYFPLERRSKIEFCDNTFTVKDGLREYRITAIGEVESYTASALECNEERLRYKLSGYLACGACLAICFKTAREVGIRIKSENSVPHSEPIIRESLVSTYLNYINDKNVFCLTNRLKKADALTLSAICYTNPKFVKRFLDGFTSDAYYDASGKLTAFCDRLAYPLAYAYYANLCGAVSEEIKQKAKGIVFNEKFEGKDLCVKALFLKKAAQLNDCDKVAYLVEYNTVKKLIVNDAKLYGYAQVIGAVPLTNPSKARLKDLCNRYDVPKSWYYVSQLENLYGLSITSGKVRVCPQVTAENVLEQLAITLDGKRIDTTFFKSTVRSMTLNGAQCYQPFYPNKLKNADNELVVRY